MKKQEFKRPKYFLGDILVGNLTDREQLFQHKVTQAFIFDGNWGYMLDGEYDLGYDEVELDQCFTLIGREMKSEFDECLK